MYANIFGETVSLLTLSSSCVSLYQSVAGWMTDPESGLGNMCKIVKILNGFLEFLLQRKRRMQKVTGALEIKSVCFKKQLFKQSC